MEINILYVTRKEMRSHTCLQWLTGKGSRPPSPLKQSFDPFLRKFALWRNCNGLPWPSYLERLLILLRTYSSWPHFASRPIIRFRSQQASTSEQLLATHQRTVWLFQFIQTHPGVCMGWTWWLWKKLWKEHKDVSGWSYYMGPLSDSSITVSPWRVRRGSKSLVD